PSLSAQHRFSRRGGDPSRTQRCDPADELHRNRFGEWEMDRPLSQVIAPEFIFERREERPGRGKQRIVFLEAGEIQHRLSVQLISGHTVPDALQCLRNGPPDRGAHLLELRPHRLGLRSDVLVNRVGNAFFHTRHSMFRHIVYPRRYPSVLLYSERPSTSWVALALILQS